MTPFQLPATVSIYQVTLRTHNVTRLSAFYKSVIGLKEIKATATTAQLSTTGQEPAQLVLEEDKQAPVRNPKSPGLFHVAWLLPSRPDLARAFRHLQESGWPLQGLGDHLVSEAIYLADPDGNGIEIYADRPVETWPIVNGQVQMDTLPVNVPDLLASISIDPQPWQGMPAETIIGHIHLQVSSISQAKQFYCDLMGFSIRQSNYPGALFVAAGNYHHHLGLNTWRSQQVPPGPANQTGLASFAIQVPDAAILLELKTRLAEANISISDENDGSFTTADPDQTLVSFIA